MSRSPQPDTKTRDDPDIQTKCGNGNRVLFHNRGSPPQDGGSFNKAGCQFFETLEAVNPMAKRVSPGCPAELEVRY
jgi:hypothetical protein